MRLLFRSIVLLLAAAPCLVRGSTNTIRSAAELYHAVLSHRDGLPSFDLEVHVNSVNYEDSSHVAIIAVGDDSGNTSLFCDPRISYLPKPGDVIRATGRIQYGWSRKRHAMAQSFSLLRHGKPPEPIPATLSELLSGGFDYKYVRVSAIVREFIRCGPKINWYVLGVVDGRSSIAVPVLADPLQADRIRGLIGQEVIIHGFCTPVDPGPLLTGRQICLCDPSAIQPSPARARRNIPSIDGIGNLQPGIIDTLDLHSASGTVIAVWQDQHALLREPNGNLVNIDFLHPGTPPVGAAASVIGFPKSNFVQVNLINAKAATVNPGARPPGSPSDVGMSEFSRLRSGDWDPNRDWRGKLLRVRGKVLAMPSEENRGQMLIGDGRETQSVEMGMLMSALTGVSVGCDVQLTGVCVIEAEAWRSIAPRNITVRFVPRFASDFVILSRPSWWTPGRFLAAIGALLASLLGILLWNVLLRRASTRRGRELAREQLKHLRAETKAIERTRLAVELHDTLSQNLTGVSLEISAAEQCGVSDTDGLLKHLSIASKALDSCRQGLRDSLWDLRNRALEERDMNAAIRKTLQPHVKGIDLVVRFNVLRSRISEKVMHDILCIVRELALNGIRHGGATAVTVAGCLDGDLIAFSVRDNGCGFDPERCPGIGEGHFGLEGIRERLSALSGAIAFESVPGHGTKAKVTIRPTSESDEED